MFLVASHPCLEVGANQTLTADINADKLSRQKHLITIKNIENYIYEGGGVL